MHVEYLPWTVAVPTSVLIARAVFLLERGQTDRQTDATGRRTHTGGGHTAGLGNYTISS